MVNNSNLHELSLNKNYDKIEIYNKWADSYEEYVKTLNYQGPQSLVNILNKLVDNNKTKKWNILDFGCGTGLLGLEIKNRFKNQYILDGIDISSKMIEKSQEKQIYNNLWNIDIEKTKIDNSYDLVLSSGVFLEGHASFKIINSLIDITTPHGMILITIRNSYITKNQHEYDLYIKNNKKINIINEYNISYLTNVTCILIIAQKI